ncbi:UNVERIFIED_CONTAM: Thaumatin-like protein [Sesamum radiatum]|uniref:Thaumatin-like protein n=1 Tax=Sesamum radiatum TaxID=300843 RepID=A0AAW2MF85_SESRA
MSSLKSLPFPIFLLIALLAYAANAATFDIRNNCPFTVWAAAVPGGGRPLNSGQTWTINVAAGTQRALVWARTAAHSTEQVEADVRPVTATAYYNAKLMGLPQHTCRILTESIQQPGFL